MDEDAKIAMGVTGGTCGCLLLAFAVIVFIVAAAVKWVVS